MAETESPLTDAEYDSTLKELQNLEEVNPQLSRLNSPTQRIGGSVIDGLKSFKHEIPMLSLDKVLLDPKELEAKMRDWASKGANGYMVEPKVDGVSVELCYRDGVLSQVLNRGKNGETGNDVTANAKTIKTIPLTLKRTCDPVLRVRGEICMLFRDFKIVNEQMKAAGKKEMANPRNAAAGALQLLDPKEAAKRRLTFVPYHVVEGLPEMVSQDQLMEYFEHLGFMPMPMRKVFSNVDDAIEYVIKFEALRRDLPFPNDGSVIKVNDFAQRRAFPDANRTIRWGYAYKYAPEQAETKVKRIHIQVGRSGMLTPVAELEPVDVSGSEVESATIHNENILTKLDVRDGDTVIIEKKGEIIPGIVSVVLAQRPKGTQPFRMPDNCPCCNSPAVRRLIKDGEEESVARYCSKPEKCPDAIKATIRHWCGKEALDIEGAGPALLEVLVDRMGIDSVGDLYHEKLAEQLRLAGVGPGITANFVEAVDASRSRGMERVLVGLGVDKLGRTLSRRLARVYPDVDALLRDSEENWSKHLTPVVMANLKAALPNIKFTLGLILINAKEFSLKSDTYNAEAAKGALLGKTLCITGTLSQPRDVITRMAEAAGAKVVGSVSKKLTLLLVGDDSGSKLDRAKALGTVTIITEEQFMALIAEQ